MKAQLTPLVAALRGQVAFTERGARPLISNGLLQPKPLLPLRTHVRCGVPFPNTLHRKEPRRG